MKSASLYVPFRSDGVLCIEYPPETIVLFDADECDAVEALLPEHALTGMDVMHSTLDANGDGELHLGLDGDVRYIVEVGAP